MSEPLTAQEFKNLRDAAESSFLKDKPYRDNLRAFVRATAGNYYGGSSEWGYGEETGASADTPLNLEAMFVRGAMAELSADRVQAMVETEDEQWKMFVDTYGIALNRVARQLDLSEELNLATHGALYGLGIVKIGQELSTEVLEDGSEYIKPRPYVRAVDFGRFVRDGRARRLGEADFLGHDQRVALGVARRDPLYDPQARLKLTAESGGPVGEDHRGTELELGSDLPTTYRKWIDIREVWIRPLNRLVAWPLNNPDIKLLDMPWKGHSEGPYVFCGFEWLLNHALPMSPLAVLHVIHQSANAFLAKAIEQQQKQKNVLGYDAAAEEEVKRIVEAVENQTYLRTGGHIQAVSMLGAAQSTVGMFQLMRDLFSYAAGNMDQRSGLDVQAPTLGQEQLLARAADRLTESMRTRVLKMVRQVFEALGWYVLQDSWSEEVLRKPVGPRGDTVAALWTPEVRRELRNVRCDVRIDPYSLGEQSPQTRLSRYLGGIDYVQSRFRPDMAAEGVGFDVTEVIHNIGKLMGEPMFERSFIFNQDSDRMMAAIQAAGRQMSDSSGPKRYVRENVASGKQSRDTTMRMFGVGSGEVEVV